MTPLAQKLPVRIRRLNADGDPLYVGFSRKDLERLAVKHGSRVLLDIAGKLKLTGILKTSGSAPWLAPDDRCSNAQITTWLRQAGFEHGDNADATIEPAAGRAGNTSR